MQFTPRERNADGRDLKDHCRRQIRPVENEVEAGVDALACGVEFVCLQVHQSGGGVGRKQLGLLCPTASNTQSREHVASTSRFREVTRDDIQ